MRCFLRRWWATNRLYSTAVTHLPLVELRPYQISCLDACRNALKSGASRIGVSLPTGSGKTTVFITLLSMMQPPEEAPRATRALIIVNSIELARQAAAQTQRLFPQWTVEIEQGAKNHASGLSDITIATYQTLLRAERLEKFDPQFLKAVIVDEAHHAAAPSYRRILSYFSEHIRSSDSIVPRPTLPYQIPIIGFSATFSRHDGLALGSVFERIVYHQDFLQMIKDQWLCNVRFTSVRANIDLSDVTVNSRTGDFNATSLAHVINTPMVNKLIVQTWLDRAADRKSTLVFCVNLAHVRDLTNVFRQAGVDARYVYAGTPTEERRALIAAFKAGVFPVLLNCAILTEGADIPNINCVVVARPTRSRNVFAQMIGRGMRLSPDTGKEDCRIIDFVDSTSRVPGVVSTPSLFGLDPEEVIDDVSVGELEERRAKTDQAFAFNETPPDTMDDIPNPKSVTYIDYDDPFSFHEDSSGVPNIHKLSRHAWVGCGSDVYVLECMGKGFIRIEPFIDEADGETYFKAQYTPSMSPQMAAFVRGISPYQRSRQVLTAKTLTEAVKGCDTYAIAKVVQGQLALGLLRSAKWRKQPATASQIAFVKKRYSKRIATAKDFNLSEAYEKKSQMETMTKGEAANIITRVKHGAQSRHEKRVKVEKRINQKVEREAKRKAREHVAVGPLPHDGATASW